MERKNKGNQKEMSGGETVKTRRRWKAEEKLAIIKEVKEGNSQLHLVSACFRRQLLVSFHRALKREQPWKIRSNNHDSQMLTILRSITVCYRRARQ